MNWPFDIPMLEIRRFGKETWLVRPLRGDGEIVDGWTTRICELVMRIDPPRKNIAVDYWAIAARNEAQHGED